MAVLDKYVHAGLVSGRTTVPGVAAQGWPTVSMVATFETAAADDDGSVFRIFPSVPSSFIPKSMRLCCDAITGSTDWDCGLYKPGVGGAVVNKEILANGVNISAGYSRILGLDLLVTVDLANALKSLWELAGATIVTKPATYDICLTANTIGSGAATVTVYAEFWSP